MVHDSQEVRAAALRSVRLLTSTDADVSALISLNLHHLVARSIDLDIDNKHERVQALKLLRRCVFLGPTRLAGAMGPVRALVSLVDSGMAEKDRLYRAGIAVLCELSVLNPNVFAACNGVTALTRQESYLHSDIFCSSFEQHMSCKPLYIFICTCLHFLVKILKLQ